MGGIDKGRFRHFKSLLGLSDEAFELADRHNLDEFRLRPVLQLPPDVQAEMVQQIVQFNLTGRQVQDIIEKGLESDEAASTDNTPPQIRRFVKVIRSLNEADEQDFVRGLVSQEKSVAFAAARIEATIQFLTRVRNQLNG
jgi:hypothetical protein